MPFIAAGAQPPLLIPVHRVMDSRARHTPDRLRRFNLDVWPEAVRDFNRCGIQFLHTQVDGEIKRSPAGQPVFSGIRRGVINLVVTDRVPMDWDSARALAGVSTLHQGHALSLIALHYAHAHRVPFLSVNTCVHELLHVLLQDIFVDRPGWFRAGRREVRVDWVATRLWLFRQGEQIREPAAACLRRLQDQNG